MGSYQYAVMYQRGTAIELQITDPSTINQLLDRLAATIEGFGASACKLPGGDLYYWRLYGLGKDLERAWALIAEHFCAYGWASLDDPPLPGQETGRVLCFGFDQEERSGETILDSLHRLNVA
jgi:hypothetical protein